MDTISVFKLYRSRANCKILGCEVVGGRDGCSFYLKTNCKRKHPNPIVIPKTEFAVSVQEAILGILVP